MFDIKSDYALNKKDKDAIVCPSVTGVHPEAIPQFDKRLATRLGGIGEPLSPFRDRFEPQENDKMRKQMPDGVFFCRLCPSTCCKSTLLSTGPFCAEDWYTFSGKNWYALSYHLQSTQFLLQPNYDSV